MLEILDTGINNAQKNMKIDSELLDGLSKKQNPILHLYEWERPSLSFGHFINLEKHLNLSFLNKYKIDYARRPTGGGIVFHLTDYAFSFLVPKNNHFFSINPLDNYKLVNHITLQAIKKLILNENLKLTGYTYNTNDPSEVNFCMAHPTKYDVVVDGKKVAGAAQRKTKDGFLHQGTISLALAPKELLEKILLNDNILPSMLKYSFAPLGNLVDFDKLINVRAKIKKLLIQEFQKFINEADF